MKKRKNGRLKSLAVGLLAVALSMSVGVGSVVTSAKSVISENGKYYATYQSLAEAQAAAADVVRQVAAEGITLLKNKDNEALPLGIFERNVTVFGAGSEAVVGVGTTGQFGGASTGGITLPAALREGGYRVNPKIETVYKRAGNKAVGNNLYDEAPALNVFKGVSGYEQTYAEYSDAAIVIFSRMSGEGSDIMRRTNELSDPDNAADFSESTAYKVGDVVKKEGVVYTYIKAHAAGAWNAAEVSKNYLQQTHARLFTGTGAELTSYEASDKKFTYANGKKYKHPLMLTDAEEDLIQYVESQNFKRVIVLINSSSPMEVRQMQDDSGVDAMLWISRPGANGLESLAKILDGAINPSGSLPDLWFTDFTKDPTWYNFGDNSQTGSNYKYTWADSTVNAPEFDEKTAYTKGQKVVKSSTGWSSATTFYEFIADHPAGKWDDKHVKVDPNIYNLNLSGVEYEEDIYLNYRYAETMDEVDTGYDYAKEVTYPFGYGLCYKTKAGKGFTFDNMTVKLGDAAGTEISGSTTGLAGKFEAGVNNSLTDKAEVKTLDVFVDVKNNTPYAGKKSVQVYVSAPFDATSAKVQKAKVALVGYEKSPLLLPGQTKNVKVTINVQDLASYDAIGLYGDDKKGYVMDQGEWKLMVLENSHAWSETANGADSVHEEVTFNLENRAYINLDDYTGSLVKNLFSKENGIFYTLRDNTVTSQFYLPKTTDTAGKFNKDSDATSMKLLTRADMSATGDNAYKVPVAPTEKELKLSDAFAKDYQYWFNYMLDGNATANIPATTYQDAEKISTTKYEASATDKRDVYVEDANKPWLKEINEFIKSDRFKTITQRDPATKQTISLEAVAGLDFNDNTTKIKFLGKEKNAANEDYTPRKAWDEFLNDLTWDQLVEAVTVQAYYSGYVKGTTNAQGVVTQNADGVIGMGPMAGQDSPLNLGSSYQYTDSPLLAATFNKELAEMKGKTIGDIALSRGYNRWWGPCVNLHRSPFGGRTPEYHSSDPILTAYTSANEALGAQSKGLCCTPKHAVLNDQETDRNNLFTWVSEQAIREIYAKPLQVVVQDGEAMGMMGAFNRIGNVHNYGNYNFITGLLRNEWGMQGSYTTDIGGAHGTANPEMMIRAGLNDVNNGKNWMSAVKQECWDATKRDGKGNVIVAKGVEGVERESLVQYYFMRKSAESVFYMHANSAMSDNWYNLASWTKATAKFTQGAKVDYSAAPPFKDAVGSITYKASGLPQGLVINEGTGQITGISAVAGTFEVTVSALLDGWVQSSAKYTITVDSAFAIDALNVTTDKALTVGENGAIAVPLGNAISVDISSETIVPSKSDTATVSIAYSLASGVLPKGLAINEADASISGTATQAGSYPIKICVERKTVTGSGYRAVTTIDKMYIDLTLNVAGTNDAIEFRMNNGKLEYRVGEGAWVAAAGIVTAGEVADGKQTITITNPDGSTKQVVIAVPVEQQEKPKEQGCGGSIEPIGAVAVACVLLVFFGVVAAARKRRSAEK